MDNTILLIVDVQHGLIDADPYNTKGLIQNIQTLIQSARENEVEIIYIQHNGGATTTFDNDFFSGEATVNYYEQKIWNGRIADVMPVSEVVKEMPQKNMDC